MMTDTLTEVAVDLAEQERSERLMRVAEMRRELADQLSCHHRPPERLITLLRNNAEADGVLMIFSQGTDAKIDVVIVDDFRRGEVLTRIDRSTQGIIDHSQQDSAQIRPATRERPNFDRVRYTLGEHFLDEKKGHTYCQRLQQGYHSRFAGIEISQSAAEELIYDIMQQNLATIIHRDRSIDVFNSSGQGVRLNIRGGLLFLGGFLDSASYVHPKNRKQ